jgi:hypothetical protein
MHRYLFEPAFEASNNEYAATERLTNFFTDVFKGLDYATPWRHRLGLGLNETSPIGGKAMVTISGVRVGYPQAMAIYAYSQNKRGRAHLGVSTLEYKGKELKLTGSAIKKINKALPQRHKAAVDRILDWHDNVQYPRLAKIYFEQTGAILPKEDRYMPIRNLAREGGYHDLLRDFYDAGVTLKKGFTKARTDAEVPFKELDFFDSVVSNAQQVEHYIAYANVLSDISGITNRKKLRTAMGNADPLAKQKIDTWLADLAHGKIRDSAGWDGIFDRLRRNASVALIGFNPVTVAKQMASIFPALNQGDTQAILYTLARMGNPIEAMGKIEDAKSKSAFMRSRSSRLMTEMVEHQQKGAARTLVGMHSARQNFLEMSYAAIRAVDRFIATSVWQGTYLSAIEKGASEKDAVIQADMLVAQTQSTGDLVNSAELYRKGGIKKGMLMFSTDINQAGNMAIENHTSKPFGHVFMTASMLFMLPGIYMALASFAGREAYQAIGLAEENDDDSDSLLGSMLAETAGQVVGFLPGMGWLGQSAVYGMMGESQMQWWRADSGMVPLSGLEDMGKGDIIAGAGVVAGVPGWLMWLRLIDKLLED